MKDFLLTHKKTGKDIKVILNDGDKYITVEYKGGPDEEIDESITMSALKLGYECNGSGWCMNSNVRDIGFTKMEEEE